MFTPTVVQVAAGVLSGLSYILETGRTPGLYQPTDLNTLYMLKKAMPLLGTFFFDEIKTPFKVPYTYKCVQDQKDKKDPARCKNKMSQLKKTRARKSMKRA
jgi:homospermidine synthase